jgi:hypothetical protein
MANARLFAHAPIASMDSNTALLTEDNVIVAGRP